MTLIGMFEARCFRLQAAEGGVGDRVGGTVLGVARRAAGVCRLRLRHGQAACSVRSALGVDSAQMIPMAGNIAECSCVVTVVSLV